MSSEDALTALYVTRQDLLRQLAEVDQSITAKEAEIEQKRTIVNIDEEQLGLSSAPAEEEQKVKRIILNSMKDPNGLREGIKVVETCKLLQENPSKCSEGKIKFRNLFITEIIQNALILFTNTQGNDLLIKVLGLLYSGHTPRLSLSNEYDEAPTTLPSDEESEFLVLLNAIKNDMGLVACNTSGARVMQKLIDCLLTKEEVTAFIHLLDGHVIELAKDINGHHSLAKLMGKLISVEGEEKPIVAVCEEMQTVVYSKLADNCFDICKNRQGCCIIQRCIHFSPEPCREKIIDMVISNTLKLVQDPFGNYVIQHILDKEDVKNGEEDQSEGGVFTKKIIRQMLYYVAELSCNKFSSNVIEKCLKRASPDVRQLMVDELTDPQVLPKLLTDGFANYVIQTAISTSNDSQLNQLRDAITPLQGLLKNSPYGVKIDIKLSKKYREIVRKNNKRKEVSHGGNNSNSLDRKQNQYYIETRDRHKGMQNDMVQVGQQYIPRMAFSHFVPPDGQVVPQMFAANIGTEGPFYPAQVPVVLSPQSVMGITHPPDSPQSQPQAGFAVNMISRNVVPQKYN